MTAPANPGGWPVGCGRWSPVIPVEVVPSPTGGDIEMPAQQGPAGRVLNCRQIQQGHDSASVPQLAGGSNFRRTRKGPGPVPTTRLSTKPATLADIAALPPELIGEIIDGVPGSWMSKPAW